MALKRSSKPSRQTRSTRSLMVGLDEESKNYLTRTADLRGISISDYVRLVTVAQAHREVESAQEQVIALTPEEQLAFWYALHQPVRLSEAQRQLGAIMRGDA